MKGHQRRRRDAWTARGRSPRSPPSCASSSSASPTRRAQTRWRSSSSEFGEVQARFEELGGYALEARARGDPRRARVHAGR